MRGITANRTVYRSRSLVADRDDPACQLSYRGFVMLSRIYALLIKARATFSQRRCCSSNPSIFILCPMWPAVPEASRVELMTLCGYRAVIFTFCSIKSVSWQPGRSGRKVKVSYYQRYFGLCRLCRELDDIFEAVHSFGVDKHDNLHKGTLTERNNPVGPLIQFKYSSSMSAILLT